jgi:hypothetical protein
MNTEPLCRRCGKSLGLLHPNGRMCLDGHFYYHDELLALDRDSGLLPDPDPVLAPAPAAVPAAPPAPIEELSLTYFSTIAPVPLRWLWPGRVPLGKITVLDGNPDLGKSVLTLDLAARLTTGRPMPDGSPTDLAGPAGVVLLSAEDGPGDTIRPRLDAAGADVARVARASVVADGVERLPELPGDVKWLHQAITRVRAALVVIDPLMAFLSPRINSFRDQDVRRALTPLAMMAEHTGAAVLIVRHLNKNSGIDPLYRGGGSVGIIGAARAGLLVAADPDDPANHRRVLVALKNNLARKPAALAYRLEGEGDVPHIEWEGEIEHTGDSLLNGGGAGAASRHQDPRPHDLWLTRALADGPRPARAIIAAAAAAGINEHAVRRACRRLHVRTERSGFGQGAQYTWALGEPTPMPSLPGSVTPPAAADAPACAVCGDPLAEAAAVRIASNRGIERRCRDWRRCELRRAGRPAPDGDGAAA